MSQAQLYFLNKIAGEIPQIAELLSKHIADNEEVLPTVFMGEVARLYCESCRRDWPGDAEIAQRISDNAEAGLAGTDEFIHDLVSVGFIEGLIGECDVPAIRSRLGRRLARALSEIYPESHDETGR